MGLLVLDGVEWGELFAIRDFADFVAGGGLQGACPREEAACSESWKARMLTRMATAVIGCVYMVTCICVQGRACSLPCHHAYSDEEARVHPLA